MGELIDAFQVHPVEAAVVSGCGLVAVVLAVVGIRQAVKIAQRKKWPAEDVLTVVIAVPAAAVGAQGMWNFFRHVLELPLWLTALSFFIFEGATLVFALRARKGLLSPAQSTGIEGTLMWVSTAVAGVFSASDSDSVRGALFRLLIPFLAAFLWHRLMRIEHRQQTGARSYSWTITPERVLIRLGLADPTDRTASEVGAERRIMELALAVKRARTAPEGRKKRKALARLERAMERAVEYAKLGSDPEQAATPEEQLMRTLGALLGTEALLTLTPAAPWAQQSAPVPALPAAPEPDTDPDGTDSPAHRAAEEAPAPRHEADVPLHEAPEDEAARRDLVPVGTFASTPAPQEAPEEAPAPRHEADGAPDEALHSDGTQEALPAGEVEASGVATEVPQGPVEDEAASSTPVPLVADTSEVQALTSNPQRARAALKALGLDATGKAAAEWLAQRGVVVDASSASWRGAVSRARQSLKQEAAQRAADEAAGRVVPLHRSGAAR